MNNHLKLLQWCIENSGNGFTVDYRYTLEQSWLSGDVTMHCIKADDVDDKIKWLEEVKAKHNPRFLAEKRKLELLAELERLNAELSD
jgi:hypothetical protein